MNKVKMYVPGRISKIWFVVSVLFITIAGCEKSVDNTKIQGEIKISYTINAWDHPTVIWLEDSQKKYLRTIYVSDWLSNSGYLLSYVCPGWSSVADWGNVSESEIDAVTSATPVIGTHEIILNCTAEDLSYGTYYYFIESHIQNIYNIHYTGKIIIGDVANSTVADVNYIPEAHPDSAKRAVLTGVSAEYRIIKQKGGLQ